MNLTFSLAWLALGWVGLAMANPVIVERTAVQQMEDGPTVTLDYDFRPGETVYFTFRLAKFETVENDDKQKLELAYRIEVADADGTPVVEAQTGKISTEMLPEDRNWTPKGRWNFTLPDHAEDGKYKITLVAQDLIGKTEVRSVVAFSVRNWTSAGRWPANSLIFGLGSKKSAWNGSFFSDQRLQ